MSNEVALIALAVARELLLGYFRIMETAGMTPEQKQLHYEKVKAEFHAIDVSEILDPEDLYARMED